MIGLAAAQPPPSTLPPAAAASFAELPSPLVVLPPPHLAPAIEQSEANSQHAARLNATLGDVARDDQLVERCKAGDRVAFGELFAAYRADVARLVQRMLGPTADMEDVVQEVFFQVHRSIKDFRGTARFYTWLYRVTVNVVLMHRRALRSRPVLEPVIGEAITRDRGPLPDEQVARLSRVRAFYRLLDRLSEKKRTVFVLHEIEGMSPADIAKLVSAPILTVRTRLFYARRELLALLREEPALAALADELAETFPMESQTRVRSVVTARKEGI
jgi:RNA polymerase sigma-70 factor (ECF subfamily)